MGYDDTVLRDLPRATEAEWRDIVDRALKGAGFETLVSHLVDGVEIQPIHPLTYVSHGRAFRGSGADWTVTQRVDAADLATAHALVMADLQGGANGLDLVLETSPRAHHAGLRLETRDDMAALLDGVMLDMVRLRVDAGTVAPEIAALFVAHATDKGLDLSTLTLDAGLDPIGQFAASGRLDRAYDDLKQRLAAAVRGLADCGIGGTWLTADGRVVHAAGGSEAQELAFALGAAVSYLRLCDDIGIAPEVAARRIEIALVADEDVFVSTAKLRAIRLMWARAMAVLGLGDVPVRVHAETAWRTMARRDPHVNILRAAAATAAAAFGGADSLTVLPFSAALGVPNAFARRVARNTQIVLLEESGLGRVLDPAAGAGHVEDLSRELAQRAWDDFREMESEGGLVAALRSGGFQNTVAALRDSRLDDVVHDRTKLTGVNAFPALTQPDAGVLDDHPPRDPVPLTAAAPAEPAGDVDFAALVKAFGAGATVSGLSAVHPDGEDRIAPIHPVRLSADFEALCDAADALTAETGERPRVFLAPLGALATFSARATWSANLFATGGLDAPFGDTGFDTPDAALAEASAAGAAFVVLCGSDQAYVDHAEAFAMMLSEAGIPVWLAGRPGPMEEALRAAGVSEFIFSGCDMLAMARRAHRLLGVGTGEDI